MKMMWCHARDAAHGIEIPWKPKFILYGLSQSTKSAIDFVSGGGLCGAQPFGDMGTFKCGRCECCREGFKRPPQSFRISLLVKSMSETCKSVPYVAVS